jgi:predicted nucleic acid-binding protein
VIVVDASVIVPVVADHGVDGHRYRQRLRGEAVAIPDLARIEVISVIRRLLHAGALDESQAVRAVDDLLEMSLVVYPTAPLLRRSWALRRNVTTYDACYVALAELFDCSLLTVDARLAGSPGVTCAIELL